MFLSYAYNTLQLMTNRRFEEKMKNKLLAEVVRIYNKFREVNNAFHQNGLTHASGTVYF